jgi:hypothetical protein
MALGGSWQQYLFFRKFHCHEQVTVPWVAAHLRTASNPSTQTARVHVCPAIKRSWAHVDHRLDHTRRL